MPPAPYGVGEDDWFTMLRTLYAAIEDGLSKARLSKANAEETNELRQALPELRPGAYHDRLELCPLMDDDSCAFVRPDNPGHCHRCKVNGVERAMSDYERQWGNRLCQTCFASTLLPSSQPETSSEEYGRELQRLLGEDTEVCVFDKPKCEEWLVCFASHEAAAAAVREQPVPDARIRGSWQASWEEATAARAQKRKDDAERQLAALEAMCAEHELSSVGVPPAVLRQRLGAKLLDDALAAKLSTASGGRKRARPSSVSEGEEGVDEETAAAGLAVLETANAVDESLLRQVPPE